MAKAEEEKEDKEAQRNIRIRLIETAEMFPSWYSKQKTAVRVLHTVFTVYIYVNILSSTVCFSCDWWFIVGLFLGAALSKQVTDASREPLIIHASCCDRSAWAARSSTLLRLFLEAAGHSRDTSLILSLLSVPVWTGAGLLQSVIIAIKLLETHWCITKYLFNTKQCKRGLKVITGMPTDEYHHHWYILIM